MTYGLDPGFPVEAHMIERILPIIFEANYPENFWMDSDSEFDRQLAVCAEKVALYDRNWKKRIRKKLQSIMRKNEQKPVF